MRGSLVHDALYQLMRMGLLGDDHRHEADSEYRKICIEDGMSRIRAWWHFEGVNLFAASAAKTSARKLVKIAPVLLITLLTACTGYTAYRSAVISIGAEAADVLIKDAKGVICKGPAGAISREFWQNPRTAAAWATICHVLNTSTPTLPPFIQQVD